MPQINVDIPDTLLKKLHEESEKEGRSLKWIVRDMLRRRYEAQK